MEFSWVDIVSFSSTIGQVKHVLFILFLYVANYSCLFDIQRFVMEKNLDLIGASWFRTKNDDFINFGYGFPEEDVCGDRYPCDVNRPTTRMPYTRKSTPRDGVDCEEDNSCPYPPSGAEGFGRSLFLVANISTLLAALLIL